MTLRTYRLTDTRPWTMTCTCRQSQSPRIHDKMKLLNVQYERKITAARSSVPLVAYFRKGFVVTSLLTQIPNHLSLLCVSIHQYSLAPCLH